MGEIFAVDRPAIPLRFTGERMTSDASGQIEFEHLHRYCFARLFCRGKDVVDVAAGEGYGSALLAQVANRVVGVEMAGDAVEHAVAAYRRPNLHFVCGDVRCLPLPSDSADVVVSFETIEHLYEQEAFLTEIRRVLRPDGLLVISSPDSEVYSFVGSEVNPFHVRELTGDEFKQALHALFANVDCYAQRVLIGSAITIDGPSQGITTFERRDETYVDARRGLPRAPYLVAIASAHPLEAPCQTLYIDQTQSAALLTSRFGGGAAPPAGFSVAAASRAAISEANEKAALAEIDKQRLVIAELTRQCDGAQLAAAEAVHAEITRLRAMLAAAERVAEERGAEADAAGTEVARLRQVVAGTERLADELRAATEREIAGTATIADLTARLAERTESTAETEAALQVRVGQLTAELADLNTRLQEEASRVWRIVRVVSPRRVGASVRAGDRARRAGNWMAAARYYRRALDRSPGLTAIWVQLGHALKEQGNYAAAEAAYRRALALDEGAADTHLQLGHLFKLQSRWGEAADAYAKALQLDPGLQLADDELDGLAPRLVEQGDKARDARNWPAAARSYRRALDHQPGLTAIWVQLGHALKEQGDHVAAEAAYRRALALDEAAADTHLQLGHLLKLQARRSQAIEAYAKALRLEPELVAAREALHALVGYSPSETERAITARGSAAAPLVTAESGPPDRLAPVSPAERYGPLFGEASRKSGAGYDVIWLGVIDWHFRIQRPQHLATNLADAGARICYISLVFEAADSQGRFRIIESPHPGVFEVRMRIAGDVSETIYRGLSTDTVAELQLALDEVIAVLGMTAPVVLVEHPAWHEVACGVSGATVVYDCLDLATGFSNVATSLAAAEDAMLARADLVIAASQPLAEHLEQWRSSIVIRNAAEVDFFARAFCDRPAGARPVIGYFGAIADWFAIEWIERCAAARPHWEFHLVGRTDGCDIARAEKLPNVRFFGEKPYEELPLYLRDFDVAVIPFRMVELTRCTNPVKLYEYMAAGKPVVAAPMPEVIDATDLVYIADDARSFGDRIAQALAEDSPALRTRRQEWARAHTWASRARQLSEAIDASLPLVSVIVLTYNNWDYTNACLFSVRNWSDYRNLEIIVVDNASVDQTRDKLRQLAQQDERIRVILNDDNLGFAAGNNVGLRAARGDYAILLNNDTVVTRGWVRDLIRPMQLDPQIGLAGPLTNNIGNEQKVKIGYRHLQDMPQWARHFVRGRLRRTFDAGGLAFFCVAIRRDVLDTIGLLDEAYGIGFFEDDDYCRRAKEAGYRLVIVDDVFIHHHLSVSFDTLGAKAADLMARNRVIFEERWGEWQPHRYRAEPGFG